jgi:choice-of-anchor C domain-containing protein
MKPYCLLLSFLAAISAFSANLVTNGSFELPVLNPSQYAGFGQGTNIAGWTVLSNDVDLVDTTYFGSASGVQSLDLNGGDSGAVFQDLTTSPGVRYRLRFALGANTVRTFGSGPDLKQMEVLWGNSSLGIFTQDIAPFNSVNVGWRQFTLTVTGSGKDRLTFRSLSSGTAGPALDDVSVVPESESSNLVAHLSILTAVQITFPTDVGKSYQVQWAAEVDTNVWYYIGTPIVGDGKTNHFCDPIEMNPIRLYRVVEVTP